MECIYCNGETKVTNSRLQKKTNKVWRRRKCVDCQGLFTSLEVVDLPSSVLFKHDKKRAEPFRRDNLFISIYEACKHRKRAQEAATALTDTVLSRLRHKIHEASLSRQDVITTTTEVLRRFDKAAATTYSAYHPTE